MRYLSDLKLGESAYIQGFTENNSISLKLLEMGCLPESKVCLYQVAPLGCPICIEVEGTFISLRRKEAKEVIIKPSEKN
ncbi:MAG: ferrous iron transport protein A [Bacteroidetes bacterium]|nr:MAG: ferrous iron transport protein A [Bacteroidota bacterium]